jgi:hypothetical protein
VILPDMIDARHQSDGATVVPLRTGITEPVQQPAEVGSLSRLRQRRADRQARLQQLREERLAVEASMQRIAWLSNAKFVTGAVGTAVLEIHSPTDGDQCSGCECACGEEPWPCATVVALLQAAELDWPPEG